MDTPPRVHLYVTRNYAIDLADSTPGQAARSLALHLKDTCQSETSATLSVAFMNMRNFVAATGDAGAQSAFLAMDYVYPDGVGLQIARRMTGMGRFRRVSGTDTVPLLLAQLPQGSRAYLVGGTPDIVAAVERRFPVLFPQVELAGCHHGFVSEADDAEVIRAINAASPDLLLLGMGTPLQETWLQRNRHKLQTRLAMCVGGLFHYWAGDLRRAPMLLQRIGLEWMWILMQQPHKWRTYSIDALRFGIRVLRFNRGPKR